MGDFFAGNYSGAPFKLFGAAHLVMIAAIVLINLAFMPLKRYTGEGWRRTFRYTLAAILIIDEAAWHWWHWWLGVWDVQTLLPLHLCSVLVFVSAVMLVNKNYTLYEFVYFMGLSGATQAILTPDAGPYGFPHFRFFQVFVSHGSIVTAALFMTIIEGYRPTWQSVKRVFIGMNIYMVFVGLVNWALDSNYMFIAHKPYTPSLLDYLGPWPWYLIWLEVIGLALMLLLYLPFVLKDRRTAALSQA